MHGNRKPNIKRNFFGDFPFNLNIKISIKMKSILSKNTYLRIVHEKVALSRPRVPQTSNKGGNIIPKEKAHTMPTMRRMLSLL